MTKEEALQAIEQVWHVVYKHGRKLDSTLMSDERIKAYDNLRRLKEVVADGSIGSFKPDWANYAQGVKDGKAEVLLGCNEIDDKGMKP